MSLSPEEVERYARHIVLRGVGGPGQQRLKASSLLVIGAGGLGAPVIAYCAAAGVGRIGIVDDDTVALSNLQRQILYQTSDVGAGKAAVAGARAQALNPAIAVEVHAVRMTEENAAMIGGYDVIADCTDDPAARYVISDAAFRAAKPLVSATVARFDGSVTVLKPYEAGTGGRPNPTYRCLFPEPPAAEAMATCAEVGVLGPAAGVIGSLQAVAALRTLLGEDTGLVGRLLLFDGRDMRFETIAYEWDPANPLTGTDAG
ncbi:MAG: ThiF family adenylyltransferase [Bauldia sp.]